VLSVSEAHRISEALRTASLMLQPGAQQNPLHPFGGVNTR